MGNCNSESAEVQKCKGCGIGGCACTAGLDTLCGRCDPSWKKNTPGTYDAAYSAWLQANPRPVKPVFDPQPPLNAGDFICVQCTQCQDFSNITAGGKVDITDPSQAMQCIGKIQDKIAADKAASSVPRTRPIPDRPILGAPSGASVAQQGATSNNTLIFALGGMFLLMIVFIIMIVMMRSDPQTGTYSGTYGDEPFTISSHLV